MEQLAQLGADIAKLWGTYGSSYLNGIKNTLVLALVATLIGCLEPVSATVLSALFLGTRFSMAELLGFSLILLTVFLSVLERKG